MLTEKQKTLFKLLEIAEEREADMRKHFQIVRQCGYHKDFTKWLDACLKSKWRRENERVYVGD